MGANAHLVYEGCQSVFEVCPLDFEGRGRRDGITGEIQCIHFSLTGGLTIRE